MTTDSLPTDGTIVSAMTIESIEYDTPSVRVVGPLKTEWVELLKYTKCSVGGRSVDPETVRVNADDAD